jgi:hypothetical protein
VAPVAVVLAAGVVVFVSELLCARTDREKRMRPKIAAVDKKIRTGGFMIPPRRRKA